MTQLLKPVARRTSLDPRLGPRERGDVTVTLYPNNMIGFRKLKRRHEVLLSLDAAYSMALKSEAKAMAAEKRKLKQIKRSMR